jgi:hypothetical protein
MIDPVIFQCGVVLRRFSAWGDALTITFSNGECRDIVEKRFE